MRRHQKAPHKKVMTTIAHISTVHPALDGRVFYREALSLKRLGYDVVVWGVGEKDQIVDGIEVRSLPAVHSRGKRFATSWYRALKIIKDTRADIFHLHDPELLPAALLAKNLFKKHVVFDVHEDVSLILHKDWLPAWSRGIVTRTVDYLDRHLAARVDAIVVATTRLRNRYQAFAQRCETFQNFPAEDLLRERDKAWVQPSQRTNEVVHLGTLSMPRLQVLLQLAKEFLNRNRDWSWRFIGLHPPQLERYSQLVSDDYGGRLRALGKIPHLEVAKALCTARAAINFHELSSQHIQVAIPVKVFEYLACGLPTVTTRVPLLVELVGDCSAVVFAEDQASDLLRELEALVTSHDLDHRSQIARQFVDSHFNCQPEAKRLAAVYTDILQAESTCQEG